VEDARTGARRSYTDPDRGPLGDLAPLPAGEAPAPAIVVRDLTATAITELALGAEPAPALSLTRAGDGLAITFEGALPPARAIALLDGFAGRLADPVRHLL